MADAGKPPSNLDLLRQYTGRWVPGSFPSVTSARPSEEASKRDRAIFQAARLLDEAGLTISPFSHLPPSGKMALACELIEAATGYQPVETENGIVMFGAPDNLCGTMRFVNVALQAEEIRKVYGEASAANYLKSRGRGGA